MIFQVSTISVYPSGGGLIEASLPIDESDVVDAVDLQKVIDALVDKHGLDTVMSAVQTKKEDDDATA